GFGRPTLECRCSSVVERTLGKGEVKGSSPFSGLIPALPRPRASDVGREGTRPARLRDRAGRAATVGLALLSAAVGGTGGRLGALGDQPRSGSRRAVCLKKVEVSP